VKDKFKIYLKKIGVSGPFLARAEYVADFFNSLFPHKVLDIHISEYINEEGTRQYENMWLFTSEFCLKAKNFLTEERFDATPINKRVMYWEITKKDYLFGEANRFSRMTLEFSMTPSGLSGSIKASRENCDNLLNIFKKYIMANTLPGSS
jgi:hypothetical protein